MNPVRFVNVAHRRNFRYGITVSFLLGLGIISACESQRERVSHHEDGLAAAGFIVKPADTPERQAMLNRLPPHRFVKRMHGDTVHYVYADPLVCGCLYVGTQQAYEQYKVDSALRRLDVEGRMTSKTYSDPAWNWGAWGPFAPGYEFFYGPAIGW